MKCSKLFPGALANLFAFLEAARFVSVNSQLMNI